MKPYKDLSPADEGAWFAAHSQPPYRVRQLHEWLYERWALAFAEMSNLPATLRTALDEEFRAAAVEPLREQRAVDGTRKFLLRLLDGETLESVLIPAPRRNTVCVSTQVGCPVRCAFCASGQGGFVRNLTPAEIIDQVVYACRVLGERVNNIVVMGMGEPLLNLDNLLNALDRICAEDGLGFGARHVTVSTSGIVPGIRRLAEAGRQWTLALSLHAVSDEARARLIPDTHRYPLAEVLDACRAYREQSGRMVTLEYALVRGRNDGAADLAGLARIAGDLRAKVNLIPCNPAGKGSFAAPDRGAVRRFADGLAARGVQVSVRREMGADIQAACGQLRRAHLNEAE